MSASADQFLRFYHLNGKPVFFKNLVLKGTQNIWGSKIENAQLNLSIFWGVPVFKTLSLTSL